MSGQDIADEVAAAIREAGAETGNGTPLVAYIVRQGAADTTTYPPTPGAETKYACDVLMSKYSVRDRAGTNISESDLKVMISPDAATTPENGDVLEVAGDRYALKNVEPYKPGGIVLYWTATAEGQ